MRKGNLLLLLLIVCFTSCEMLESHPYDAHITGERGINAKNCERIEEAMKGKKTFRFAMISDTQRWYCLLYTSPSPRDRTRSRMPSSA